MIHQLLSNRSWLSVPDSAEVEHLFPSNNNMDCLKLRTTKCTEAAKLEIRCRSLMTSLYPIAEQPKKILCSQTRKDRQYKQLKAHLWAIWHCSHQAPQRSPRSTQSEPLMLGVVGRRTEALPVRAEFKLSTLTTIEEGLTTTLGIIHRVISVHCSTTLAKCHLTRGLLLSMLSQSHSTAKPTCET